MEEVCRSWQREAKPSRCDSQAFPDCRTAWRHFHTIQIIYSLLFPSSFIIYHRSQFLSLRRGWKKKQKFRSWQKKCASDKRSAAHFRVSFVICQTEKVEMTQKEKVSEKHFGWCYQRLMGMEGKFMEIFKVFFSCLMTFQLRLLSCWLLMASEVCFIICCLIFSLL